MKKKKTTGFECCGRTFEVPLIGPTLSSWSKPSHENCCRIRAYLCPDLRKAAYRKLTENLEPGTRTIYIKAGPRNVHDSASVKPLARELHLDIDEVLKLRSRKEFVALVEREYAIARCIA